MGLSRPEQIYQKSVAERASQVASQSADDRSALLKEIQEGQTKALDDMTDGLKLWIASPIRREKKINADKWDFRSRNDLVQVISDLQTLGIYQDNDFYRNIVSQLSKTSDPEFLKDSPEEKALYLDPFSNMTDLSTKDPAFVVSLNFFASIKNVIAQQDLMALETDKTLKEKDEEPITSTIADAVKDNYNKFTKAIKSRDYATAGVYVLGIFAMYKAYKSLPQDSQGKLGKWLAWGGALYAGLIFAKNAGYDILKKTGIRDVAHDVEGTPLNSLKRLDVNGVEDLDYGVFLSLSNTNLSDLYTEYQRTNDPSIQFIAPDKFPGVFPLNLRYEDPDEYQRTGKELYKLVASFKAAYDKTYLVSTGGMTFEDALNNPVLRHSTVFDFMASLQNFVPAPESGGFLSDSYEAVSSRLGEYFSSSEEKAKNGWMDRIYFNVLPEFSDTAKGEYMAIVNGFPLIVREVNDEYLIFPRSEFLKSGSVNNLKPMAKIPKTEGETTTDLVNFMNSLFENVKNIIRSNSKTEIKSSSLKHVQGNEWEVTDVNDKSYVFEVNKDGTGINVLYYTYDDVAESVDDVASAGYSAEVVTPSVAAAVYSSSDAIPENAPVSSAEPVLPSEPEEMVFTEQEALRAAPSSIDVEYSEKIYKELMSTLNPTLYSDALLDKINEDTLHKQLAKIAPYVASGVLASDNLNNLSMALIRSNHIDELVELADSLPQASAGSETLRKTLVNLFIDGRIKKINIDTLSWAWNKSFNGLIDRDKLIARLVAPNMSPFKDAFVYGNKKRILGLFNVALNLLKDKSDFELTSLRRNFGLDESRA